MSDIRLIISRNRMLVFDYKRESVKRYIDNLSSFLSYVRNDDDDDEIEDGDENDDEEEEDDFGSVVSGGFPDEDDAQMNAYLSGEGEFDYLRTEKERVRRRKRKNLKVPFEIRALEAGSAYDPAWVEAKLSRLMQTLEEVLDRSAAEQRPTHEVAGEMARERIAWTQTRLARGDDDAVTAPPAAITA